MLWAYKSTSTLLEEDALIPFDKTICSTNDSASLSEDYLQVKLYKTGWYIINIEAVLGNSSTSAAIIAGLRLISNDVEIIGSERTFDIPISGSIPVSISVPVYVKPAASGIATVSWQMTDQAIVETAVLSVLKAS